jgi:adenylate cyclase
MAIEIERKFLIKNNDWKTHVQTTQVIKQGYLSLDMDRTVRVRLVGNFAQLTIKSKTIGNSRHEFEYEIPVEDAQALVKMCIPPILDKTRHLVLHDNLTWEVDIFSGENEGLRVAEVELDSENTALNLPDWVGQEVSGDARYYNANLIQHPFCQW